MRYGLFLMPLHPPERPVADAYEYDLRTLQAADALGFDEAWIGEHFTSVWENIPAPDLFIARALGVTQRIRLGTGVVLLPFHHPVHVALRLACLDHLARGRLMVGIGSGGIPADREFFGLTFTPEQNRTYTRECLEIILKIWAGEPFTYEGELLQVRAPAVRPETATGVLLRPYQQPHPPIAVAGVNRTSEGLALAGERGWIPLSTNFLPGPALREHWAAYAGGAARGGHTPQRSAWRIARDIYVAETSAQARREARDGAMARAYDAYMLRLVGSGPRGLGIFKPAPDAMPDEAVTVDYLLEHVWIVGSPAECVARLRALSEEVGGFGTVLMIGHDWMPHEDRWFRSLELFATRVMPELAEL
jgi:alkanesulfonate monooxygenase SsuD/methylene tetrahydromethanopterin reductase-like flavin-dependent oxidoreductase (luciferase family)